MNYFKVDRENKKMYSKLAKLDIFTVDPASLQREKSKTKTNFGGFLTVMLSVIPIFAFMFLYIRNSTKAPIVSEKIVFTKDFNYPIISYIDWNPKYVNVETKNKFFLLNMNSRRLDCLNSYHNDDNVDQTKINVPLCNYLTDLKGEPNGIGVSVSLNLPKTTNFYLPFEDSDKILFLDKKNFVAYINQPRNNQFCLIRYDSNVYNCYDLNYYTKIPEYNSFIYHNDVYFSIYSESINTIILFKNGELETRYVSKSVRKFISPFILTDMFNYKIEIFNSTFTHKNGLIKINNIARKVMVKQVTDLAWNIFDYMVIINDTSIEVISINYTMIGEKYINNVTISNVIDLPLNVTYDSISDVEYQTIDSFLLFTLTTFSSTDSCIYEDIQIFSDSIIRNTYVYSLNLFTSEIKKNNFSRCYFTQESSYIQTKFLQKYENVISIVDTRIEYMYLNQFYIVDVYCNVYSKIGDIVNYNGFFEKEIVAIWFDHEEQNFYLFLQRSSYPYDITGIDPTIKYTGPVYKCSLSWECFAMFSTSLNTDYDFEDDIAGHLQIDNQSLPIMISDLLLTKSYENDIILNAKMISKKQNNYIFKNLSKTLYNFKVTNKKSQSDEILEYQISNANTGSDKKFTCMLSLFSGSLVEDFFKFTENLKDCLIFNTIFVPFIFDYQYFTYLSPDVPTVVDSLNITGFLLLGLDDTFHETQLISTQDSIYTLIGSIGGLFSTLMTTFVFLKTQKYNRDNKDEINRRLTVESNIEDKLDDIKIDSELPQTFQDKVNVQLSYLRNN